VRAKAPILIACLSVLCFFSGIRGSRAQTPTAPPAAGTSFQDSANELYVGVGKTVLVDCVRPVKRVAIGLGDVAEASVVTPTEIMVNGKTAGETSLIIWDDRGGRQFFNVTVRASVSAIENNVDSLRRELRAELPGQSLKLNAENGVIYLRGTVDDLTSSARAVQIASAGGKVVNLLNVKVPAARPQILLKVRFASIDRSKAQSLGINLFSLGLGNAIGGVTTGQFYPPTITGGSGSSSSSSSSSGGVSSSSAQATMSNELNIMAYFPSLKAGATIEALQTKGVVQVLAEPNVLAMDGKQASFLAGGQYPYPVVQGTSSGSAAVTIMFKEYGVRLNFIPTITPRNTIRLQVAPEVSSLDFTDAVTISGFTVPAITTRKMNTQVELGEGQTLVLGGLLDNRESETFQKIPFIGDIPILGKLFQSKTTNKTNTELIVLVTPEIVSPIPAEAALPGLKYPAKFLPPNSNIPMHNPDAKTADNTQAPAPATMPVEKLIQSMKPETPLVIDSATGGFGAASSAGATATTTDSSSSPQQ
jgi:pilus assembly protein CpaC